MLSRSCVDPWPEGSVGLEEKVVTAVEQNSSAQNPPADTPGDTPGDTQGTGCYSSVSLDDGLTSLQWLQDFSILNATVPQPLESPLLGPGSDALSSALAGDPASLDTLGTPGKSTAAAYSRMQPSLPGIVAHGHCPDDVDYKTNVSIKPPYSYATLICMAMEDSEDSKITLSSIYKYITDNFCYYRYADPTWKNSIRHNLSTNKCFIKVPRQKNAPGKGGFWKIDPQYAERLLSGAYKKRQMPSVQINPALQNRLQANPLAPSTSPCSPMGPQTSLCIHPDSQHFLVEFEEAMGSDQNWDPDLAGGTMLGSWPMVRGRNGLKRKQSLMSRSNAKAPRRSSSPLLSVDEQKELGTLKGDFDWDALLDSALSRELSLDGGGLLSPIMKDEDLTMRGTHIFPFEAPAGTPDLDVLETHRTNDVSDFDEETFLVTALLESSWPEDEDEDEDQGPEIDENHPGEDCPSADKPYCWSRLWRW